MTTDDEVGEDVVQDETAGVEGGRKRMRLFAQV